jgi:formate hydrogenlyase subunit 6/NADH:ubiquinone oxidoreductase subunit I
MTAVTMTAAAQGALALAYEDCVRTRSRAATCSACVDACPTGAVGLSEAGAVSIDLGRCVSCALCQAACPTEALRAPFDVAAFVARAGASLRCGEDGLPCVGALAAEDLVVLARRHGGLLLQAAPGCAAAARHGQAARQAAEAGVLLRALGEAAAIRLLELPAAPAAPGGSEIGGLARRELLRRLVPGLAGPAERPAGPGRQAGRIDLEPARLDAQRMRRPRAAPTARRQRLLAGLAGVAPAGTEIADDEIGFASSKKLDPAACTACRLCVNTCPTGALSASVLWQELRFDASRCVRCGLCHDVCAPRALGRGARLPVEQLLRPGQRVLGRLTIGACGECGALFKREGGAALCPRCQDLDDEARELVEHRPRVHPQTQGGA